jgi:hypothetical protein
VLPVAEQEMTFAEKIRTIGVVGLSSSPRTKTRVDDHGTHSVEVTEHVSDRVDVTVKPGTTHKGRSR